MDPLAIPLVEVLYNLRCGLEALGKRGAEIPRSHLRSAERDLTRVLEDSGLPVGQTAAEADFCKLALMKAPREPATNSPAAPAAEPLTARIERDRDTLIPQDTLVIVSGGRQASLRWPEYVLVQPAIHRPHFEAMRRAWEARADESYASKMFVCSDGVRFGFTDRAWGDFLASLGNACAVNPTENYMDHWP